MIFDIAVASNNAYALHYWYITKGGLHMEWMNRGQGQGQPTGQAVNHTPAQAAQSAHKQKGGFNVMKSLKIVHIVLLFSVTALLVALLWFVALGKGQNESRYVDNGKLQAVFLNGGQVYFGNITDLNESYLTLSNIYYLRVNQQVQPDQNTNTNSNDISLVKLGCELHGPQDSMVINRDQIIFWENLKDDGQVAKAVQEYRSQNPNGQKCETNTGNNNATGTTNDQSNQNTNNNTNTNNATGTGTGN